MKNNTRVLAIDYGTKRVGIAISDELRMLAFARGILPAGPTLIEAIKRLVFSESVGVVVLGIPRTLAGGESEMTREVTAFHKRLEVVLEPLGVIVATRDERLTSLIAETNIRSRELPKSKRENKSLRDEEAARILLQEYLDSSR